MAELGNELGGGVGEGSWQGAADHPSVNLPPHTAPPTGASGIVA